MLDTIREGLARVWDSGGRQFVTFELAGDDAEWVQWIDGQVNLAWPRDDDPARALPRLGVRLPAGATVMSWQPGSDAPGNVIVHAFDVRIDDTAALVRDWFVRVFDAGRRDAIDVRVESA